MHFHARIRKLLEQIGRYVRSVVGPRVVEKQTFVPFPRHSLGARFLLPRTKRDYAAEVGDLRQSNLVMITMNWIARTFPEAPLRVWRAGSDGIDEPYLDHPVQSLIDRPNPFYSGTLLMAATAVDYNFSGNAYWFKIRNDLGEVVQLWWIPSHFVEPVWPSNPTPEQKRRGEHYISGYSYKPDPEKPAEIWKKDDVVHFRYNIDPYNIRKGASPISTALREIFTDEEATNFTASMLDNFGVPGVVISPRTGGDDLGAYNDEQGEAIKYAFQDRFGGDNVGEPLVMTLPTNVDVVSWSPEQMNLRELRLIPEERVSALLGIPAIVLGVGAGLERSTFTNFGEAREAAIETHTIPQYRNIASDATLQLLPDFFGPRQLRRYKLKFDTSVMRILQEDETTRFERFSNIFERGMISRYDAKRAVGLKPTEEDKVYKLKLNETFVDASTTPEEWRKLWETLLDIKESQAELNWANVELITSTAEGDGESDGASVDTSPTAEEATEDGGATDPVGGLASFDFDTPVHPEHESWTNQISERDALANRYATRLQARLYSFYASMLQDVADTIIAMGQGFDEFDESDIESLAQAERLVPEHLEVLYAGIYASSILSMSKHVFAHTGRTLDVDLEWSDKNPAIMKMLRKMKVRITRRGVGVRFSKAIAAAIAQAVGKGLTEPAVIANEVVDQLRLDFMSTLKLHEEVEDEIAAMRNLAYAAAADSSDRITPILLASNGDVESGADTLELWESMRTANGKREDIEIVLEVTA